jgi:hypothetical protein
MESSAQGLTRRRRLAALHSLRKQARITRTSVISSTSIVTSPIIVSRVATLWVASSTVASAHWSRRRRRRTASILLSPRRASLLILLGWLVSVLRVIERVIHLALGRFTLGLRSGIEWIAVSMVARRDRIDRDSIRSFCTVASR